MTDSSDENPLLDLLEEVETHFEKLHRRLDQTEEFIQAQNSHIKCLASTMIATFEVMNRICNHNSQDKLSGAMAVGLMQRAFPSITPEIMRDASRDTLARMSERGWLSDLQDLEAALKRQKEAEAQIAAASAKLMAEANAAGQRAGDTVRKMSRGLER